MGPFFDNSVSLVNCSIGEPFMMKNFDDLLILHNLRRLIAAKGGRGGLPRVHLVFMPMRVNVHELEAFVRICADLEVDRLVLRPLNYSPSVSLDWDRAGYRFEYQKELLPFEELVRVSGRAAEICRRLGVHLADQMDFGGSMGAQFDRWFEEGRREVARAFDAANTVEASAPSGASSAEATAAEPSVSEPAPVVEPAGPAPAEPLPSLGSERKPICTEPWKSLYILRRGVFPCCYGGAPLAKMDGYRDAWNSPEVQAIRAELAAGRFHDYCLSSPAYPIVGKAHESAGLTTAQSVKMETRRAWARVDRAGRGWPGRIYGFGKRVARRALG